jgi:hypothetical protein
MHRRLDTAHFIISSASDSPYVVSLHATEATELEFLVGLDCNCRYIGISSSLYLAGRGMVPKQSVLTTYIVRVYVPVVYACVHETTGRVLVE